MKRRTFLKSAGLIASGLAASSVLPNVGVGQAQAADKGAPKVWKDASGRPNILVILVDQLRFPQGLFSQQVLDAAAPNLAWLRREGVSYESHFAAATMCSPSRSTMLTGLYTHQNGRFLTDAGAPFPTAPDLDPGFPTWGSILNSPDFRYNTYWWGKWHLSDNDATSPDYAQQYGFIDGGLPCPAPNTAQGLGLGADPITVGVFNTWLAEYSNAESGPFCTTVSLTNPHDVAWFPGCTYGRPPIGPNPATPPVPGEDSLPPLFDQLPGNFERWPEALTLEGKPTLQQVFVAVTDLQAGFMSTNPDTPEEKELWYQLLDLYVQVTSYVDQQIGNVLYWLKQAKDKNGNSLADNTIVVFTADHGEYGGAHGMRDKGFAVYEESIHVPLYVYDPTGTVIPAAQRGTTRSEFTSHVDLLPLLMTLAGGSEWRNKPQYAHLAGRANLAGMLGNPQVKGRDYIIHTADEDYPELLGKAGVLPEEVLAILEQYGQPPSHVIGYRTKDAKLGVYSRFAPDTINIVNEGQQAELYNYQQDGIDEVINHSPSGSTPDPVLFGKLYDALFNPTTGAVVTELRQPLPSSLKQVQKRAIDAYLAFQQQVQPSTSSAQASSSLPEESSSSPDASSPIYMPFVQQ